MATEITTYISDARTKNISDDQIKSTLVNAGWPEAQVTQALSPSAENMPPPPPPIPHVGMWTGFLYILFFISLYILATSLGGVFHFWVENVYPNNNAMTSYSLVNYYSEYIVRGYLAAILVSFPIFAALGIVLKRQVEYLPVVKNLRSRKLMIYITLVITFLILIGNVITTIYSYLGGNLTNNTIGHFCVTVGISGSIFIYFLKEVKNDRKVL